MVEGLGERDDVRMDVRSLLSAAINCRDGTIASTVRVEIIFIATVIYLCARWDLGGRITKIDFN